MDKDIHQRIADFKQLVTVNTLRLEQAEVSLTGFASLYAPPAESNAMLIEYNQIKVDQLHLLEQLLHEIINCTDYQLIKDDLPSPVQNVSNHIYDSLAMAKSRLKQLKAGSLQFNRDRGV